MNARLVSGVQRVAPAGNRQPESAPSGPALIQPAHQLGMVLAVTADTDLASMATTPRLTFVPRVLADASAA